ncbi:Septin-4 [Nymphon striatum]|nr:Septin-4 [Nymphon striatum]
MAYLSSGFEQMLSDRDYIGFATLPEQIHRKSVKRGFDFTLMIVGESGLGKSTLINSLFLADLYKDRTILNAEGKLMPRTINCAAKLPSLVSAQVKRNCLIICIEKIEKTVGIEKKHMEIEEKGVRLRLTVVDTPGFGDSINCEQCWKMVDDYIEEQFNQYFKEESGLNRKRLADNRVHCCLYFIPPYGNGLRQIDVQFMKKLQNKVNIVPVIAKADTLTPSEVKKLKENVRNFTSYKEIYTSSGGAIMEELVENKIHIYQLPECDSDEDEEFKQQDKEVKASIPFAVIGSTLMVEYGGRKIRGRLYPWGVVEVLILVNFSTHMQDLKDVTEDSHYENYRAQYITKISQQAAKERTKLRRDSAPGFEGVTETDRLLQQKGRRGDVRDKISVTVRDTKIRRMQDMLTQMQEKFKARSEPGTPATNKDHGDRDSVINL